MGECNKLFSLILWLLAAGCSTSNWEQTDSGVIIKLKGEKGYESRLVKLEAVSDRIIHVIASPADSLTESRSLILDEERLSSIPGVQSYRVGRQPYPFHQ
jgi:alpha-D-xyloside xylohydrolase